MKGIDLKSMTFDDLIALREAIQGHLSARAEKEKRELQAKLKRIERYVEPDMAQPDSDRRPSARRRKPEPRYRNPNNPSETWAGRGLTPRWMQTLLKQGKRREDFEIPREGGSQVSAGLRQRRASK